jgi:predicted  nucleic acid-binding Zn-ribbon protein
MSNIEQAIKDLQDTLIVISEIEKRQSAMLREHSERIVRLEAESLEFRRRTDQNLAEITDKLNGLIGYVGGLHPPPPQ